MLSDVNDYITQKDIFRLAALLYTETTDVIETNDLQLYIIMCIIAQNGNNFLTKIEIIESIAQCYSYYITEEELTKAIEKHNDSFEESFAQQEKIWRLKEEKYNQILQETDKNIDYYIDRYIEEQEIEDGDDCKYAIHVYLYELTTSNINSYKVLLSGNGIEKLKDFDISVVANDLNNKQRESVHNFISWKNDEKNEALVNLVYCCLEYCLLISGDSPNPLIRNAIKNRTVYLDTNIIFRALGINGKSRKNVIRAFLAKCNQAKFKLIISKETKNEFWDTINYYISQITKYPRGQIYIGAYEKLSDYNLYSFYNEWKNAHKSLTMSYFKKYVHAMYSQLIEDFLIYDGEIFHIDILKNQVSFVDPAIKYASNISHLKNELHRVYSIADLSYSQNNLHDAKLIRYIEILRERNKDNGIDDEVYFVSADKGLRLWDMTRDREKGVFPITLYPSQLFLILIKLCGRSKSDFDSFVSFINIRTHSDAFTPEQANIIVSGISSVTEDITQQKRIVNSILDDDMQSIINSNNSDYDLYHNTQIYSQHYLESELKNHTNAIATLQITSQKQAEQIETLNNSITEQNLYNKQEKEVYKQQIKQMNDVIAEKDQHISLIDEKIIQHAKQKTYPLFLFRCYVVPVTLLIVWIIYILLILLQFFFCDKQWNISIALINYLKQTTFGLLVENPIFIIDSLVGGFLIFIWRKFMINFLSKTVKSQLREKFIEEYLLQNNLK